MWLNEVHQYFPFQGFGGHKQSGLGCENSLHGLMEYTNWQTITLNKLGGQKETLLNIAQSHPAVLEELDSQSAT